MCRFTSPPNSRQAKEVSQEEQKDCFSALDTEQKAHLTKTQVKVGVRALGKSPTEAEIDAVLKDMRKYLQLSYRVE